MFHVKHLFEKRDTLRQVFHVKHSVILEWSSVFCGWEAPRIPGAADSVVGEVCDKRVKSGT